MQVDLINPNGKVVASDENKLVSVAPNQTTSFRLEINIKNPQLWNVEKGVLYKVIAKIRESKKTLDENKCRSESANFISTRTRDFGSTGKISK